MGRNKVTGNTYNPRRAWLILLGLMSAVSFATAGLTTYLLARSGPVHRPTPNDILSLAEAQGTFGQMKAELNWPALDFGIEGNALVIEGSAESEYQIQEVLTLVRRSLKAESYYIVHPYIERADMISGRIGAVREGNWDYKNPGKSLLVVDLMKVRKTPLASEPRVFKDPLAEAQRILSTMDLKPIPDLQVELLPLPRKE